MYNKFLIHVVHK